MITPTAVESIRRKFESLGARIRIALPGRLRVDVVRDRKGETFELDIPGDAVSAEVAAACPRSRHLVLQVRTPNGTRRPEVSRYVCGFDERHWFVAAVHASAGGIDGALQQLKPSQIRAQETLLGLRPAEARRRRNIVSVRQGEWFFVPAPEVVDVRPCMTYDVPLPLRSRGSKPHRVQFVMDLGMSENLSLWRTSSGRTVVLRYSEYLALIRLDPGSEHRYQYLSGLSGTYAKGWVRHPDHRTLHLAGWHRFMRNTERSHSSVAFSD